LGEALDLLSLPQIEVNFAIGEGPHASEQRPHAEADLGLPLGE